MQAHELKKYLRSLSSDLLDTAAHIVAETATAYYKESFRRKAFDGKPWKPAKRAKRKGSLLVASSAMMHSIRPSEVSPQRVVISAGNDKVTYAQAHNEGFVGSVNIPAHDSCELLTMCYLCSSRNIREFYQLPLVSVVNCLQCATFAVVATSVPSDNKSLKKL